LDDDDDDDDDMSFIFYLGFFNYLVFSKETREEKVIFVVQKDLRSLYNEKIFKSTLYLDKLIIMAGLFAVDFQIRIKHFGAAARNLF
jgi:hypothetical protein